MKSLTSGSIPILNRCLLYIDIIIRTNMISDNGNLSNHLCYRTCQIHHQLYMQFKSFDSYNYIIKNVAYSNKQRTKTLYSKVVASKKPRHLDRLEFNQLCWFFTFSCNFLFSFLFLLFLSPTKKITRILNSNDAIGAKIQNLILHLIFFWFLYFYLSFCYLFYYFLFPSFSRFSSIFFLFLFFIFFSFFLSCSFSFSFYSIFLFFLLKKKVRFLKDEGKKS